MIQVKIIDREHRQDIRIPNDPFPLHGRMIPTYREEKWHYTVEYLPETEHTEMCFPDENYDFDEMSRNSVFIGAYDGEKCVGLIVLQSWYFKYMYVPDLKVAADYRRRGIGKMLIQKAAEVAASRNYRGIYLQGQDNNLNACLFYLNAGFRIGGLDTEVYKGTSQEGKADILFYLDA